MVIYKTIRYNNTQYFPYSYYPNYQYPPTSTNTSSITKQDSDIPLPPGVSSSYTNNQTKTPSVSLNPSNNNNTSSTQITETIPNTQNPTIYNYPSVPSTTIPGSQLTQPIYSLPTPVPYYQGYSYQNSSYPYYSQTNQNFRRYI